MSVGRPAIFETNEQLSEMVNLYFARRLDQKKPATITGLALFLGFESRQSFYDYEEKDEFSYTIKRARLMIENIYEENLIGNNVAGSIFALKNLGWKDKTETELSGQVGVIWNEQKRYETK